MQRRHYLDIFYVVQKALFLRELNMRFSSSRLGLFWTFFEPFFQVLLFILLKIFLFGDRASNFEYAVFLALNFTAFNMFRNIVTKSIGSFSANRGLFIYKQVKPIDTIIARVLVEIFITSIIILMFLFIGYYFEYDMNVGNFNLVAFGFLFLIVFSFSLSLCLSVANTFINSVKTIVKFLMNALMFGSAIFYSLDMLSEEVQAILLYNPLTHFIVFIHSAYFQVIDSSPVDYTYMILWTTSLLFAGLWYYIKLEKRIISL
ncbi:MAG: ABC transporter permease [Sulfurovum sp.]|nr:ABC transporter permease [Sulfurovum sp.]